MHECARTHEHKKRAGIAPRSRLTSRRLLYGDYFLRFGFGLLFRAVGFERGESLDTNTAKLRRSCNARQGVPNRSCTRLAGGCGNCCKVNRGGASPTLSLPEIADCPECFDCSDGMALGRLRVRSHGLSVIREQNCNANLHLDRYGSNAQHTPIVVTGGDPRPTRPLH